MSFSKRFFSSSIFLICLVVFFVSCSSDKPENKTTPDVVNDNPIKPLKKSIPMREDTPEFLEGEQLLNAGNYKDAIQKFTEAIKKQPKDYVAYVNRGVAFHKINRQKEAINDYTRAIQFAEFNAQAYNNRSISYQTLGRLDSAEHDINYAIKLNPNSDVFYLNKADIKRLSGDFKGSIADLDKAISFNANSGEAHNNRGFCRMKTGDFNGALEDFDFVLGLKLDSKEVNGYTLNNRGYTKYKLRRYEEGLEDIKLSLEIMPDNPFAFKNRAEIYIAQNKTKEACGELAKAERLNFTKIYGNEVKLLREKFCK